MDFLKVGTVLKPKGQGDQLVIVLRRYRLMPFMDYQVEIRKLNGQLSVTWTEKDVLSAYEPINFDPVLARLLYIG